MSRSPFYEFIGATMLFTRLPVGRLCPDIPVERFAHAVTWWPAVGWFVSGMTASVVWLCAQWTSMTVAAIVALVCRVWLTGALHEDGLADVADGLGGRVSRERALEIMKDSHIGAFGVLALVMYCMLFVGVVSSVTVGTALWMIVCGGIWARFCAGRLIVFLPYARREGAKNGLAYPTPGFIDRLTALVFGVVPMVLCVYFTGIIASLYAAVSAFVTVVVMSLWFKRRIGGYTGDCCGAACVVCEIVYMFTFSGFVL